MSAAALDAIDLETDHGDDELERSRARRTMALDAMRVLYAGGGLGIVASGLTAFTWSSVRAATGAESLLFAAIVGAVVGYAVRVGSGRGGGLPALVAVICAYFAYSGSVALQLLRFDGLEAIVVFFTAPLLLLAAFDVYNLMCFGAVVVAALMTTSVERRGYDRGY